MKLFGILGKDMKVFFRDIRSFLLLFLTPICIVLLIGSAFLSTQPTNVPIVICGEQSDFYNSFVSLVRNAGVFVITEMHENCEESISAKIKNGEIRAGIITPENEFEDAIVVSVDNTKPVSVYIESYFNLITKDLTQKMWSNTYMSMVNELKNASEEIDGVYKDVETEEKRVGDISGKLTSLSGDIKNSKNRLQYVRDSKRNVVAVKNSLVSLRNSIEEIKSTAGSAKSSVTSASDTLDKIPVNENNTEFISVVKNDMTSLQNNMGYIEASASQVNERISSVENNLTSVENLLSGFNPDEISQKLDTMDSSIRYSIGELDMIKKAFTDLKSKLVLTKSYISELTGHEGDRYTNPIQSSVRRYFGEKRYIDFVFPGILIMILMLMSTFLSSISFIRQRNTGVLKRILLTPTGKTFFLIEKTAANLIISMIPIPFILAAGMLILNVEIALVNIPYILLICGMSSIVFTLLGLVIASFSKTETTAILASLIIVTPMIFLSGAFSPSEAFSGNVKDISAYLPITISSRLLEGFMFYSLPLENILKLLSYICIYVLLVFVFARITMIRGFR
jgi:ABC-type multidrug transport system permease subunit/predicted  nucleic acid-binding Zn-ribbon protein